jgi:hypothetical protein
MNESPESDKALMMNAPMGQEMRAENQLPKVKMESISISL